MELNIDRASSDPIGYFCQVHGMRESKSAKAAHEPNFCRAQVQLLQLLGNRPDYFIGHLVLSLEVKTGDNVFSLLRRCP